DAARGYDRHLDRIHDLRNEREGAGLGADIVAQENAPMAASLVTLRDDGIDAPRLEPARFGGSRRRTHHQKATRLDPLHEPGLRQSEVEAHDIWLGLLDDVAHDRVERGTVTRGDRHRGIDPELLVIRR